MIYIKTLKRAEHTVFCVQDGQKYYYDSLFKQTKSKFFGNGYIKSCVKRTISTIFS